MTNSSLLPREVELQLSAFDLVSDWVYHAEPQSVLLAANASTEAVTAKPCPHPQGLPSIPTASHTVVIAARIVDRSTGDVLARFCDWPQPYKFLELPEPGLQLRQKDVDCIVLEVKRPAKGVVLHTDRNDVNWSANCIDLIPGDPVVVHAPELQGKPISISYLGQERAVVLEYKAE